MFNDAIARGVDVNEDIQKVGQLVPGRCCKYVQSQALEMSEKCRRPWTRKERDIDLGNMIKVRET